MSHFFCPPSRALTNGTSTFSSELTLIDFAIHEAILIFRNGRFV